MNALKSHLTCQYCTKILKNPMTLPCGHSLCKEHLHETIECVPCNQVFNLQEINLIKVLAIENILREEIFLNDEEKFLKSKLIKSFSSLNRLNQDYESAKETFRHFEVESHEHFQEIRRQIDIHREGDENNASRIQIDTIALNMIDKTKDFERYYFKCLNETLKKYLLIEVTSIDVDEETQALNELFREPSLKIETIKKMDVQLNGNMRKVQECLNVLTSIRGHLNSNKFLPNDQETFGVLILNEFVNDLSLSSILSREQSYELIRLCDFSFKDKFTLLYKATLDGFRAEDFHSKCDGHTNTLTILKADFSSFIFGAFTSVAWHSMPPKFKSDPNAFIFSLTNKDNRPCKMEINPNNHKQAVYCYSNYGPSFGCSDIHITNNADYCNSYSNLGSTYLHYQHAYESDEARSFLAGSKFFQLSEIEIYKVV